MMRCLTFCSFCSLISFIWCSSSLHDPIVIFPTGIRSERDLPVCEKSTTMCGLLQKRFWMPAFLYRQCRCTDRSECPSDWATEQTEATPTSERLIRSKKGGAYSMHLNNRAQMKFCEELTPLPECSPDQTAAYFTFHVASMGQSVIQAPSTGFMSNSSTRVTCRCPTNHSWNRVAIENDLGSHGEQVSVSSYQCGKLRRCRIRDFCGYVTADTFSTYYRCTCPKGTLCVLADRVLHDTQQLHYTGSAYLASCKP